MKLEYYDAHYRKSSEGEQRQAFSSQADKPLHIVCKMNYDLSLRKRI